MAMINYMPRPQKKRGNKSDNKHIIQDSKQTKSSFSRGQTIGQKFLKSTIYNKKLNVKEITMNLYTYKLNQITGIIDEIVRCVVIDAPEIKRICFETGYGKPKKSIDIRKSASVFLTATLGYTANKGGTPKTFKFLNDHSNRIVIFPQDYIDYAREETERKEKEQAIIDAKNAKKERKAAKKRKKYFKHNKWKKNLKYPEPKKRPQPIYNDEGEILDEHLVTPGGDDNDPISESDDDNDSENDKEQVEETEATFLRNFMNLQVMMQESGKQKQNDGQKQYKRSWNRNKGNKKDIDIFEGVKSNKQKFEYVDPDAWRYDISSNYKHENKNKKNRNSNKKSNGKIKKDMMGNVVDNNGDWLCEFCSYKNGKGYDMCQMCFNERFDKRYESFMSVVNANNKQNEKVYVDRNDDCEMVENKVYKNKNMNKLDKEWKCGICTFINENNECDVCDMCGMRDNVREKCLDSMYDNYGDGFFQDAKPNYKNKDKGKKNNKLECEEKMNDNVKVKYGNISKKNLKKNMKVKKNVKVVMNMKKANKSGDAVMNEEIARINKEYNAAVWKAERDKEKRIEMLKRINNNKNNNNNNRNNKNKKKKWNNMNVDVWNIQSGSKNGNKGMGNKKKKQNGNNNMNKKNRNGKVNKKKKQNGNNNMNGKGKLNVNQVKIYGKSNLINGGKLKPNLYAKINFQWVDKLVKMGYNYDKAFDAVSNTNSIGFNDALDYLMHNV